MLEPRATSVQTCSQELPPLNPKEPGIPLPDASLPGNAQNESPGFPFGSIEHYALAEWFIRNRVSQSAINACYKLPEADRTGATLAYTMLKMVDSINIGLGADSWKSGNVSFHHGVPEADLITSDW